MTADEVETGDVLDRRLLLAVAAGDRDAMAALYERHGDGLTAYLRTLLRDRGQAEDALQETLLVVWRRAGSYAGRSTVSTWLFGIARRKAWERRRRRTPEPVETGALAEVADAEPGPEELTLASATGTSLAAALERLAPLHREVLVLALDQARTYTELADILGVPVGTVRSRLSNARRALRRAVEESEVLDR
jgi:RNA polymerase sigma factor (sigma-70 family)